MKNVLLAKLVDVPYIVVYLNKCVQVDPEMLELVEMEVRELLTANGFPEDKCAIVKSFYIKTFRR